ncbi:uncharacterized protein NEPG_02535 [Nematocida parisii ERTm1]|uniref:Uncharacterized protein n=1 Tax=Nematocida parisii (strain ERTm3) TaxID=935791 RepID=I3EJA1_NEMP3|nr:uncharacterized protein NEPG_02535 [Nematocida parisii ERTm1]EIJ89298.1 hypothetical protein NEQG_00068 [Nematocida parisii ERTm3]EIJ92647.1 hypothetical protein NEPG_02535 [Nematocida parisii ERTm1]|eukprot:XP_013060362.1 hypothetical protein NEPG_02535 [Nematocida parisii ERTm1]
MLFIVIIRILGCARTRSPCGTIGAEPFSKYVSLLSRGFSHLCLGACYLYSPKLIGDS